MLSPALRELGHAFTHCHRHSDRARRRVRAGNGIIEQDHQTITQKTLQRSLETMDNLAKRSVVLSQYFHYLLGLSCLRQGGESAQVTKNHGNIATMAFQQAIVACGDHHFRELRREEPLETIHSLQLSELLGHTLLECPIPFGKFGSLRLETERLLLHRVM